MKHHRHLWLKCCHQNCFGREDIIHAHVLQNVEFQEFPMRSVWSKGKKSGWLTRSSFVSRFHQRKGTTRCVLDNPVQDVKRGAREENEKIGNEIKCEKNGKTGRPGALKGSWGPFFCYVAEEEAWEKQQVNGPHTVAIPFSFELIWGPCQNETPTDKKNHRKKGFRFSFFSFLLISSNDRVLHRPGLVENEKKRRRRKGLREIDRFHDATLHNTGVFDVWWPWEKNLAPTIYNSFYFLPFLDKHRNSFLKRWRRCTKILRFREE